MSPKRAAGQAPTEKVMVWLRQRTAPRLAWEHSELAPVSARPSLNEYLHQLWDRRHFIGLHAYSQAIGQNSGTLLGRAWLVIAPLLDGLVYWLIFGVAFGARNNVTDFVPRLLVGILLFSYVTRGVTSMANSINNGRGLIRAFAFPRASLPLAAILREGLSTIPTVLTLLIMVMLVPPHAKPASTWLLIPLPLFLVSGFIAGVGLVLARIVSVVPDVSKLIGYVMRFVLYASGVIFAIGRFSALGVPMWVFEHNPVYLFIEMMRELILYHQIPSTVTWLEMVFWATVPLVAGLVYFWRGEATYGRQRVA